MLSNVVALLWIFDLRSSIGNPQIQLPIILPLHTWGWFCPYCLTYNETDQQALQRINTSNLLY